MSAVLRIRCLHDQQMILYVVDGEEIDIQVKDYPTCFVCGKAKGTA